MDAKSWADYQHKHLDACSRSKLSTVLVARPPEEAEPDFSSWRIVDLCVRLVPAPKYQYHQRKQATDF